MLIENTGDVKNILGNLASYIQFSRKVKQEFQPKLSHNETKLDDSLSSKDTYVYLVLEEQLSSLCMYLCLKEHPRQVKPTNRLQREENKTETFTKACWTCNNHNS